MLTLTDTLVTAIYNIGRFRQPSEAVGLVVKGKVVELPNRSLDSHNSFTVKTADIPLALDLAKIQMTELDWDRVILWHTHPAGVVGPSRTDMQNKVDHFYHLVVSITNDGPVATFY